MSAARPSRLFTIGHSTRAQETFLELLEAYRVELLADVRTIPRSRHNPQFTREALTATLAARGIGYMHLASLGGLRHPRRDSLNTGWRNSGFRGYADYMQTEAFAAALEHLLDLAAARPTAIMCAEAVPWRCHRWLIADALVVRGVAVEHILSLNRSQPHQLTPFARVTGQQITYPLQLSLPFRAPGSGRHGRH